MRVLHLDSGKEMRGGQWQVLSLLKGLGRRQRSADAGRRPADGRGKAWRGIEVAASRCCPCGDGARF